MKWRPLIFYVLCALIWSALRLTTPAHSATFEPSAKWPRSTVRVCFAHPPFLKTYPEILKQKPSLESPELEQQIKSAVQTEYTSEKTGIHFVGWYACGSKNNRPNADAVIAIESLSLDQPFYVLGDSSMGVAHLDPVLHGFSKVPGGHFPYIVFRIPKNALDQEDTPVVNELISHSNTRPLLSLRNELKLTALHEFGHLAGLRHEHLAHYREAVEDPRCKHSNAMELATEELETDLLGGGPLLNPDAVFSLMTSIKTAYDTYSVMSYCQIDSLIEEGDRAEIKLSRNDVLTLKKPLLKPEF